MKEKRLYLANVENAKEFVSLASKCDFEIDLYCRRTVIDAKSIIGVLSIDLRREILIKYDGYNKAFEEFVDKHGALTQSVA